ncbi:uncharacterized protein LOC115238694 [Formica exsecta]|uniref:uncharacterized protein LOC115238694 n=1 Tax=Formica exsecta TaxID=72781 RepID=UPI001142586D|nr:uncharacterized protein LOC115238694 [Formica exsecta]
MPLGILQANLNHACRAQDLFLHGLAERGFGLGVAAEPYQVPEASPCWTGDRTGSVAITWRNDPTLPPCTPVEAGAGVAVVRWGPISVLGCYISPNVGLAQYEAFLDGVSACFRRQMPRPIIVAGDFNAKSTRWGSRFTDARGEALQDWAAALGLCLINTGKRISTGVRVTRHALAELSARTKVLHTQARDVHGALREMWLIKEGENNERELQNELQSTSELPPPPTNINNFR